MKLLLQTDGGSRGNPGPAAYGYVISDITNLGAVKILEKCGNYLGITTNNQAEYAGLISGLNWIVTHHPNSTVQINMDSLLIVNQIKGLYKVKSPELLPKYQEARGLLDKILNWEIVHNYRAQNSLADSLVNIALDVHQTNS